MENSTNGEKDQEKNAGLPTAESLASSPRSGKRNTRPALSASDRLEIAQQALVDLGHAGIKVEVSELHDNGETMIGIVLYGVRYDAGRLIAINGKGGGA